MNGEADVKVTAPWDPQPRYCEVFLIGGDAIIRARFVAPG